MGVLQPGGSLDLALEALGAEGRGEVGVEDLDGDRAVVAQVMGQIDGGHAAAPKLAVEHVAVAQGVGQGRGDGHEFRRYGG